MNEAEARQFVTDLNNEFSRRKKKMRAAAIPESMLFSVQDDESWIVMAFGHVFKRIVSVQHALRRIESTMKH